MKLGQGWHARMQQRSLLMGWVRFGSNLLETASEPRRMCRLRSNQSINDNLIQKKDPQSLDDFGIRWVKRYFNDR